MTDRPFNAGEPLAYFITWTTYGTWLPGDERGWQRRGVGDVQPPNRMVESISRADMKAPAFTMSPEDREIVERTVNRHCEIRGWTLHKVNARSNHVHVVVTAPGYAPESVRDQFKAWCTRSLKAIHPNRSRYWTEGASCRWINTEDDLDAAIRYSSDAQERKGVELQARRASE